MKHQNLSTKRAAHQKKTQMLPTRSPGQRHAVETTVLAQVCSLCPLQSELDHAKLLVDHAVAVQENDHARAVVVQRFCTHTKNHQNDHAHAVVVQKLPVHAVLQENHVDHAAVHEKLRENLPDHAVLQENHLDHAVVLSTHAA